MSGTTSVPQPVFGPAGFIAPAEADILAGAIADIDAAMGGGLNPALETPQGQLASSLSAIAADKDAQFLALANSVDPAFAAGRMQDGIARIYFITRKPALPTVVQALCTGLAGVPIPTGAQAKAADGTLYICTGGGTIGVGGTVTLPFAAVATGPIPCPATTLSTIYRLVNGWDSITNPADGVLGSVVESRAAFEFRRGQSVAQNAVGSLGAILGSVLSVDGVIDAIVRDNPTAAPVTIGGVSIAARSLYVAVVGGDSLAVATAIWRKKSPGCGYTGNTTVTVTDSNPAYVLPLPTYNVTFEIPTPLTLLIAVRLANLTSVPSNAKTLVAAAIQSAFSGADGGQRLRVGGTIYASRFYAGVAALGPWAEIVAITLGTTETSAASITGSIAGTVLTVSAIASGSIAAASMLFGANVADGTTIVNQLTGTAGSTGTYTVTPSQTALSGPIIAAPVAANSIAVNIDRTPVIATPEIALILV
jgi:hypothetical protein